MTVTSPRRITVTRCGADQPSASPADDLVEREAGGEADGGRGERRCAPDSRPSAGVRTVRRSPAARRVNRIPSSPSEVTASAATSASSAKPYVIERAAVRAAIRRTIGSSALRIAVPVAGSASTSSALAASIASSEPIRERWTGWTAVTTPIGGPGDAREVRDLAADVHPHLEDRGLVLRDRAGGP